MTDYLYRLATDKEKGSIVDLIKIILFILSFIYGGAVLIMFFLSRLRPYRLQCRVISVGNITLGGTGKTSLVEYIARYLNKQGHKIAILSRGYKRKITNYQLPITNYQTVGDEPYMLAKKLGDIPVVVDNNRIKGAKKAIKDYGVDTVILDDGFQQWKIKKDLEIVTIDSQNPFGNRFLLPRGILRESLYSLKRADVFVLTKADLGIKNQELKIFLNKLNPSAEIYESIHRPICFYKIDSPFEFIKSQDLEGKVVAVFSGIADPDSFEKLICNLGLKVGIAFRYKDHHHYIKKDLDRIVSESLKNNINTIITTEKDAARLSSAQCVVYNAAFIVLRIELAIIKDEQEFNNRLLSLYSS